MGINHPIQKDYNWLEQAWNSVRQFQFPREFRITPPILSLSWADDLEQIKIALNKLQDVPDSTEINSENNNHKLIAEIGTGLWRVRKNMMQPDSDKPKEGMERAYRHVQSIFDSLEAGHVQIKDHTEEEWVDGRNISVLAFQPMPDFTKEIIIETIKPSIFLDDQHIQKGQVIVGKPEQDTESDIELPPNFTK